MLYTYRTMFSKSIKIMKNKNLIMIIIKKNVVFQLKKKKKNVWLYNKYKFFDLLVTKYPTAPSYWSSQFVHIFSDIEFGMKEINILFIYLFFSFRIFRLIYHFLLWWTVCFFYRLFYFMDSCTNTSDSYIIYHDRSVWDGEAKLCVVS